MKSYIVLVFLLSFYLHGSSWAGEVNPEENEQKHYVPSLLNISGGPFSLICHDLSLRTLQAMQVASKALGHKITNDPQVSKRIKELSLLQKSVNSLYNADLSTVSTENQQLLDRLFDPNGMSSQDPKGLFNHVAKHFVDSANFGDIWPCLDGEALKRHLRYMALFGFLRKEHGDVKTWIAALQKIDWHEKPPNHFNSQVLGDANCCTEFHTAKILYFVEESLYGSSQIFSEPGKDQDKLPYGCIYYKSESDQETTSASRMQTFPVTPSL